jgi:prolyl oligopeptidase
MNRTTFQISSAPAFVAQYRSRVRSTSVSTSMMLAALLVCMATAAAQKPVYPVTRTVEQTDTYFGTKVADPFRWLEDDTTAEVAAWVRAQNDVTFAYLNRIPFRDRLRQRLETIYNYERYSAPGLRGSYYTFSKNDGLQNQSVIYIQKGPRGKPEVLIDPNTLSTDGTTRLAFGALSKDARYYAYGVSHAGSDWVEIFVMEREGRVKLADHVQWVKVSGLSWRGDGFYYSRYDVPAEAGTAFSAKNENHRVYYHRVGTTQSEDQLVFEDPKHPQRFHTVSVTEDERFLILNISDRGTGRKGNAFSVRDLRSSDPAWIPIVTSFDDSYGVIDHVDGRLLVSTDKDAPNHKVVLIDPAHPREADWKLILPEMPQPLVSVNSAGGRIFAVHTQDVSHRVSVHRLDGTFESEIRLPALGAVSGFGGERDQMQVFYTFTSFTHPPTIFSYDIPTRRSRVYRRAAIRFRSSDYDVRQVFVPSRTVGAPDDRPKIPMYFVSKKGSRLAGRNPALLTGYGGFNVSLMPSFNPLLIAWLEQGGVFAQVNLRGGGEYGELWHQAGTKRNKQNVFNDFIAAAEWLIANRYTTPATLAIQGGSNGGLLVGAVMNQRPDLFRVALPAVGVMDMLRFHRFTIGWNWIPDYGSSDAEADFRNLLAYSPLHNIRPAAYPSTLVTTADHDDRVVPAHSFKYIAALQAAQQGDHPVLIRIETKSGHGASSTRKRIEETADAYAFALWEMGVEWKSR